MTAKDKHGKAKTRNGAKHRGDERLTKRAVSPAAHARMLMVLELTTLGKTTDEIAEAAGVQRQTVFDIRQRADYKKLAARARDAAVERTIMRLIGMHDKAAQAVEDALAPAEKTGDRLSAAEKVFDRSGVPKSSNSSVTVKGAPPSAMTTAALRAELQELLDSTAEGENDDDAED